MGTCWYSQNCLSPTTVIKALTIFCLFDSFVNAVCPIDKLPEAQVFLVLRPNAYVAELVCGLELQYSIRMWYILWGWSDIMFDVCDVGFSVNA